MFEHASSTATIPPLTWGRGLPEAGELFDGRWRIARRAAKDRVVSTVDEQARHTRKSQAGADPEKRGRGSRS